MKRICVLSMTPLIVVFLTACGSSTIAPVASDTAAPGEQTPFVLCGESTSWTRPAEEEQAAKWWDFGRYAGDQEEIKYLWTRNFFVAYGSASIEYDMINLSGLWTLAGDVRKKCIEPTAQDAILKLREAEVWVLLYRVKSVRRVGADYNIVIEPTKAGVQFIQFARPEDQVPLTLHFMSESGQEIERIVEAESAYWPYPQLIPTHQP
jgi:hypothetical protein